MQGPASLTVGSVAHWFDGGTRMNSFSVLWCYGGSREELRAAFLPAGELWQKSRPPYLVPYTRLRSFPIRQFSDFKPSSSLAQALNPRRETSDPQVAWVVASGFYWEHQQAHGVRPPSAAGAAEREARATRRRISQVRLSRRCERGPDRARNLLRSWCRSS